MYFYKDEEKSQKQSIYQNSCSPAFSMYSAQLKISAGRAWAISDKKPS